VHPTSITADRTRGILTITWDDGKASELSFKLLSDMCPCAVCNAERNNPDPLKVIQARSYELEAIHPVGGYAINIVWKGGCRYGIYSWDYLRQLAGLNLG
jgi:DUF971 family protein